MASISINILSVTPHPTGVAVTNLPAETKFDPVIRDISAIGAGRNQAYTMNKKRVGQETDISLEYTNLSNADAARILNAFNPEYVSALINHPRDGYVTKVFYVSDRETEASTVSNVWKSIKLSLIQKTIDRL